MEQKILAVLKDKINPILETHRGHAELVKVEKGIVTVRLEGACACCPDAGVTFETVINRILREEVPSVKQVVLDQTQEEEWLQIAKKILHSHTRK